MVQVPEASSRRATPCRSMSVLAALFACAFAFAGCSVDVAVPKPSSVSELKQRVLDRIDTVEKAIAENKLERRHIRMLMEDLNWLRGHMESLKVGTEEQIRGLQESIDSLGKMDTGHQAMTEDWKPSDPNPPAAVIEPGPIKDLLPQIRRIVSGIPDSDLRPSGVPSEGEKS